MSAERTDESLQPLVCIVIVNFNGRDHIGYCLPSLAETRYSNIQFIVVDNASTDGSPDMVLNLLPTATVIRSKTNRGWSGGNNLGILEALRVEAKYIVLANTDIRVDARWIQEAVAVAESQARIGVIGFRVLEPVNHADELDAGFEEAKLRWDGCQLSFPRFVGGMAMFVRSDLFRKVGWIDEGFFAYGEENDLQLRAVKAGYAVAATNVPVWHYGQGSFGRMPVRSAFLQTRNNIRLLIKHSSFDVAVRSGARHFVRRCLKWGVPSRLDAVERRLQSPHPILGIAILFCATISNLFSLRATLRTRREHDRRAALARAQLARELAEAEHAGI